MTFQKDMNSLEFSDNNSFKTFTKSYTCEPSWISKNCITYDDQFRIIRSKFDYKGDKCFKCEEPFKDGEKISVVGFNRPLINNKLLCAKCVKELEEYWENINE